MPLVEGKPIWIRKDVKERIEKLKIIPREPFYMVLDRMLRIIEFDDALLARMKMVNPNETVSAKVKKK